MHVVKRVLSCGVFLFALASLAGAQADDGMPEEQVLAWVREAAELQVRWYAAHEQYATIETLQAAGLYRPEAPSEMGSSQPPWQLAVSPDGQYFVITAPDSAGQAWSIDRTGVIAAARASAPVLLAQQLALEQTLREVAQAQAAHLDRHGTYAGLDELIAAGLLEQGYAQVKLARGLQLELAVSAGGEYFVAAITDAAGLRHYIDAGASRWSVKSDAALPQVLEQRQAAAKVSTGPGVAGQIAVQGDPIPMENSTQQPVLVVFETTKGDMVLEVHPEWSPLGAARFIELVNAGFYDGAPWFRVIDRFVAQCGISADPALNKEWDGKTIHDDPVVHGNHPGCVAFGKTSAPHSRSTHIFVNLVDNSSRLDYMGFACFARVSQGMEVAQQLTRCEYDDQYGLMQDGGLAKFKRMFPAADYIKRAYVQ